MMVNKKRNKITVMPICALRRHLHKPGAAPVRQYACATWRGNEKDMLDSQSQRTDAVQHKTTAA